jgi:hypothetical protein
VGPIIISLVVVIFFLCNQGEAAWPHPGDQLCGLFPCG